MFSIEMFLPYADLHALQRFMEEKKKKKTFKICPTVPELKDHLFS